MDKKDIISLTRWAYTGLGLKDFYEIFNVPYPNYEEVPKSIRYLSELLDNYSAYMQFVSMTRTTRKRDYYFSLLLDDIFGELAISIKLAGEGYIKYSLRGIRSVLDLLFAGLFTVSSFLPGSAESEDNTNPMAEAFFSGYWDKMKPLDSDMMVLSTLMFGEEGKGKSATNSLKELTEDFFEQTINKFNFDLSKLNNKTIQKLKISLNQSLKKYFMDILKSDKEWGQITKETLGKTDYFYWILMDNPDFALRSCLKHEGKLLEDLKNKLEIQVDLAEDIKQELMRLTFSSPEFEENENIPLCNYCENKATIFGIYSRPDTRLMSKLIKLQLSKVELDHINSCLKDSFDYTDKKVPGYFGDVIYSELYTKLNNYVHSNIAKEPNISEWFSDFVVPTFIVLQCILSRPLWTGESA
jgi:hypothetical protein